MKITRVKLIIIPYKKLKRRLNESVIGYD